MKSDKPTLPQNADGTFDTFKLQQLGAFGWNTERVYNNLYEVVEDFVSTIAYRPTSPVRAINATHNIVIATYDNETKLVTMSPTELSAALGAYENNGMEL